MINREVFQRDPATLNIPNLGVAKVGRPKTPQEWDVLKFELETFVCQGEYRKGLERTLATYLRHLSLQQQPAVWVSGFYGSGKSHFVRVLDALWSDLKFPGGATARGLATLPPEVRDLLTEISTAGKRSGGLWSAPGTLGSSAAKSVRLAMLRVVFQAADLPGQLAPARLALWLMREGHYAGVEQAVKKSQRALATELNNLYVSPHLARAIIEVNPGFATAESEVHKLLAEQFPKQDDLSVDEFLDNVQLVLDLFTTAKDKLPCALFVFDEMQQYLGSDTKRILEVQEVIEACSARFRSQVLVAATGQASLESNPELNKLQDRFKGRVMLTDSDVEQVVRDVILRKHPARIATLQTVLDTTGGEIDRHLGGSQIAAHPADKPDLVPDYPLLPTRRRFWERLLRSVDSAGKSGQLRTQLRVVLDTAKAVADKPLGWVVGGDAIYWQIDGDLLSTGALPRDTATLVQKLDDGSPDGKLKSRICALVFLIGKLERGGPTPIGIRATADTLADLLVEDLNVGSAALRQKLPASLQDLQSQSILLEVDNEYRIQTRESADWEQDFRKRRQGITYDAAGIASSRSRELRVAVERITKDVRPLQGKSKTPRKIELVFGQDRPKGDGGGIPVWVRDGWSVTEDDVRREAQAAGQDSPFVFAYLPKQNPDAIRDAVAGMEAAQATLDGRPEPATAEGLDAKAGIESRKRIERENLDDLVEQLLKDTRVFQGGGGDVTGTSLRETIDRAAQAAMVRLYPRFPMADHAKWGNVKDKAKEGATDALALVDYTGDVDKHPACMEVRSYVGVAGKKGADVRKKFQAPPYGWSQDAVDGALLVLLAGGFLKATLNTQPVTARQIPQNQIGVAQFQSEGTVIQTIHRIELRKLASALGVPAKPGEELEAVRSVLERMKGQAQKAAGQPPMPAAPAIDYLKKLDTLAGNEQLLEVYNVRDQIQQDHKNWTEREKLITERLPRWDKLQKLLAYAGSLPVQAHLTSQAEAVVTQRSLLDPQDPAVPLLNQVTEGLRTALVEARNSYEEARARELAGLALTPEWQKLPQTERDTLLAMNNLGPPAPLSMGDVDALLKMLEQSSLDAWREASAALPGRAAAAREQAAKKLEPKAIRLKPRPITLREPKEVDPYLQEMREQILGHLHAGNPVIL